MARNKDRDPSEMILGTFRVRAGMWDQFKQLASDNNVTATDLILSFIENCLQSQSIPQSQVIEAIPQPNLDNVYTYIDSKLDKTLSIQQVEDLIDSRIGGSIQAGDIRYAIAHSYQSSANQFNEMIGELQHQIGELQKQFEELSVSPPSAPVPPSAIDNSPAPADNSPAPELEIPHNKQQIIRAALSKKNIKVSSAQIRQAFYDASWDGHNFEAIRKDIEKLLGGDK